MLDVFAILTTSLCILFVITRAVMLDRSIPWFEGETDAGTPKDTAPGNPFWDGIDRPNRR